mmetsp:Transcript_29075/g.81952  ORF Transcript_29075/g.81952 Transcript_29075/m.81952 type:complete len:108 (-) Transcript_29075:85-408(-)
MSTGDEGVAASLPRRKEKRGSREASALLQEASLPALGAGTSCCTVRQARKPKQGQGNQCTTTRLGHCPLLTCLKHKMCGVLSWLNVIGFWCCVCSREIFVGSIVLLQ